MDRRSAAVIVRYYYDIPEMLRLLQAERAELEGQYNPLGTGNAQGLPRGGAVSNPTESLGAIAADRGVAERIAEIDRKAELLRADAAVVRGCLDGLNSRYKRLLLMRYSYRYSWGKISVRMEVPDSTARYWTGQAVERLGAALDTVPGAGDILGRASRARV